MSRPIPGMKPPRTRRRVRRCAWRSAPISASAWSIPERRNNGRFFLSAWGRGQALPLQHPQYHHQDHRAHGGDDDRGDQPSADADAQMDGEKTADEGADNADNDVADDAIAFTLG